jgi:Sulfotransferase domain
MTDNSLNVGKSKDQSRANPPRPESRYRRFRYELSKSKIRRPFVWFGHRHLRPEDIVFDSYPRSGSTWSRFLLFEILTGKDSGFGAVNTTLGGARNRDKAPPVLPGAGRLIMSHEPYRREYKKAIYLVRDGRDVLLSEYAFLTALGRFHGDLDQFIDVFHRGKTNGFSAWRSHVHAWLDSPLAGTPNLLVVKYEDLRSKTEESVKRMVDFLGVDVSPKTIQDAILNNSLEKMRAKEKIAPQKASVRGRFVRTGSVQGWRTGLTAAQIEMVEQNAGDALARLQYQVSRFPSESDPDLWPKTLAAS